MSLADLKKEMPYRWKISHFSKDKKWAFMVAYVDSRQVRDRLDEVCGPHCWQSNYKEIKGNAYCGIGVKCGEDWVWKWDCGAMVARQDQTAEEDLMKIKGEASDAFKRAAVQWGVGRFLYDLEIVILPKDEYEKIKWDKAKIKAACEKKKKYPSSAPPKEAPKDNGALIKSMSANAKKQMTILHAKAQEAVEANMDGFNADKRRLAEWVLSKGKFPETTIERQVLESELEASVQEISI